VETQLPPHFASAAASPHHSGAVSSSFPLLTARAHPTSPFPTHGQAGHYSSNNPSSPPKTKTSHSTCSSTVSLQQSSSQWRRLQLLPQRWQQQQQRPQARSSLPSPSGGACKFSLFSSSEHHNSSEGRPSTPASSEHYNSNSSSPQQPATTASPPIFMPGHRSTISQQRRPKQRRR